MGTEDDESGETRSPLASRSSGKRLRPEPRVFEEVSDRDLTTLADVLCRSLEFHSMLVASRVMREVSARDLWPAVVDRRAYLIGLAVPDADGGEIRRLASEQIQRFRDEHFPVEPEQFDDDPTEAARLWNAYIAF